jgi:exosortase N
MLMSPIAQYFADAFSFSIRLWLTKVAGKAMLLFGRQVEVSGNVITHNGIDFSVDPACMGLHMLLSSLLCCLLIIAVQQKRWNRQLGVVWMAIVGCAAIVLNIISNLIRILMLVQFGIMPGTLLHELLGIFCMVLYVVVPAIIGLQWLVKWLGEAKPATAAPPRADPISHFLHVLIGCLLLVGIVAAPGKRFKPGANLPSVAGYRASYYDTEIIKLESDRSLVYLKPLKGFYVSEHHPMLCWTGGGYMFKKVAEKTIAGIPVISGTLEKGKEQLYTAWWYSSGIQHTSSGMGWRWEAMRSGQPYSIVNVTAVDEQTLQEEMARVLRSETLRDWIAHSKR